jgi:hypothetical protein
MTKNELQEKAKEPSPLPVGVKEFHEWADSFADIYDLPTSDKDSIKIVLASEIINLKPGVFAVPKEHFYHVILSAAAKQVAGSVFQEIQQAKFSAEKLARRADVAKEVKSEVNVPSSA